MGSTWETLLRDFCRERDRQDAADPEDYGMRLSTLDQTMQTILEMLRDANPVIKVSADGINLILAEAEVMHHDYLAVKIAEAVESGDYLRK